MCGLLLCGFCIILKSTPLNTQYPLSSCIELFPVIWKALLILPTCCTPSNQRGSAQAISRVYLMNLILQSQLQQIFIVLLVLQKTEPVLLKLLHLILCYGNTCLFPSLKQELPASKGCDLFIFRAISPTIVPIANSTDVFKIKYSLNT